VTAADRTAKLGRAIHDAYTGGACECSTALLVAVQGLVDMARGGHNPRACEALVARIAEHLDLV
jgi:hypothetical protein